MLLMMTTKILARVLLSFLLISLCSIPALTSENAPSVRLYEKENEEGDIESNGAGIKLSRVLFFRHFGKGDTFIYKYAKSTSNGDVTKGILKSSLGYDLLVLDETTRLQLEEFAGRGIYVFPPKGKASIGYCLLEQKTYSDESKIPEVFASIRGLTKNVTYLSPHLIVPEGISVEFYEREMNGFVERYGIATMAGRDVLILDAYYPVNLESELRPFILEDLNRSLQHNPYG